VTWHFSLVQRRVKNGQTLTVKGMVKKWPNFISEVTNFFPMTPKKAMDVLEFHKNWKVMSPVQICTCEFVSTVA
jgi:hypothetical protein